MVVGGEGEVKDYPPHLCPLPQGERSNNRNRIK